MRLPPDRWLRLIRGRRRDIWLFLLALSLLAVVSIFSLQRVIYLREQQAISEVNATARAELGRLQRAIIDAEKSQLAFFLTGRATIPIEDDAARVSEMIEGLRPHLEALGLGSETDPVLTRLGQAWRTRHLRIDRAMNLYREGNRQAAIDSAIGVDDASGAEIGQLIQSITGDLLNLRTHQREQIRQVMSIALIAPLVTIGIITAFGFHYYRRLVADWMAKDQSVKNLTLSNLDLEKNILDRNAELVKLTKELKRADAQKDQFLAMLGHELRNPLAPIVSAAEVLLSREALDESVVREYASVIRTQCRLMSRLVGDLMDIGHIATGRIGFDMQVVDFRAIVDSAARASSQLATEHGVDLEVALTDEPVWLNGDGDRLVQVIDNLVHNALKFTPEGHTITVRLDAVEDEAVLQVADEGIGLPEDTSTEIFEPFQRVNPEQGEGLGLGLAIVREIVTAHQGQVEAESEGPGRGSTFTISLPRLPIDLSPEPEPETRPVELGPLRFLIVDDYRTNAESLAEVLKLHHHHTEIAATGKSALEIFRKTRPDVVLLDLGLPDFDGVELGELLLRMDPEACLIAVTGMGHDSIRDRTAKAGFAAHLTKPVRIEDLLETVADALEGQR